ncbi:MAG TPA: hypothetical protein VIX81_12660 [Gammaproteobacteria bacterium]
MQRNVSALVLLLAAACSTPAIAAPRHDPLDARQQRQQQRIADGVASGELVRPELQRLLQERQRLQRLEQRLRADGRLDRAERRHLQQRYDRLGGLIRDYRHNDWRRPPRHGWGERYGRGAVVTPRYGYGPPRHGLSGYGFGFRFPPARRGW